MTPYKKADLYEALSHCVGISAVKPLLNAKCDYIQEVISHSVLTIQKTSEGTWRVTVAQQWSGQPHLQ